LPDVEIFYNAVRYAVAHNEFFNPTNEVAAARAAIKQGLERAAQLRDNKPPGFQPPALWFEDILPTRRFRATLRPRYSASYQSKGAHQFRLDVWFHGRDEKLSELNFITQRQKYPGEFAPENAFVLHTYGAFAMGNGSPAR